VRKINVKSKVGRQFYKNLRCKLFAVLQFAPIYNGSKGTRIIKLIAIFSKLSTFQLLRDD
jgi:hypothetical protein